MQSQDQIFYRKYGLLPEVTETMVEVLKNEASEFADYMRNSPDRAKKSVLAEIKWLREHKDFLGSLVEAAVEPALDLVSDRLTHADWDELRIYLLKGVLLALQGINLGLERREKYVQPADRI